MTNPTTPTSAPSEQALRAAEIGLANLVSYQSSGNTPSIHEFGQARRALDAVRAALSQPTAASQEAFQQRVQPWLLACFGEMIAGDREERNHRFLEEALELVQACGCTASEAHQLVDYTFGRPEGEKAQEVGGVMVTLAALCLANGLDMHDAAETELARIWTKVEAIRAKQAAKPKHSPLPAHPQQPSAPSGEDGKSTFLQNLHYFFAQTDGTYKWPVGSVGDLLKQAKREIEAASQPVGAERGGDAYFSFDENAGFATHATADAARAAASGNLDLYRDDSADGWPDEVESIRWGVILGQPKKVTCADDRYDGAHGLADYQPSVDYVLSAALAAQPAAQQGVPALEVWFGSMPESNGRENWTVMLRRKEAPQDVSNIELHRLVSGFTVCRSEYKDRMRYEADRLRFLLGEIDKSPHILDYDANLHSGYVEAYATPQSAQQVDSEMFELWWADHMPKATRDEAWAAWVALKSPAQQVGGEGGDA